MSLDQLSQLVQTVSVVLLLIGSLYGLQKQWWVPGWVHKSTLAERDEWKQIALSGLRTAADMAEAAKAHTTLTPEQAEMALRIVREAGRLGNGGK